MQITVSDDVAAAARLAELSDAEAKRAWIIGLFAEHRLSLLQAAKLAGLDRESFKRHLASHGIALASGEDSSAKSEGVNETQKPWLALRGSGRFVGDPFAPVVSEEEIVVLQKSGSGIDR
jgi:predicted HTH domain antitoxin